MFYIGRFLQLIGLGITGFGCLIAFDPDTTEASMWTFCLVGLVIFWLGHAIIPKS